MVNQCCHLQVCRLWTHKEQGNAEGGANLLEKSLMLHTKITMNNTSYMMLEWTGMRELFCCFDFLKACLLVLLGELGSLLSCSVLLAPYFQMSRVSTEPARSFPHLLCP